MGKNLTIESDTAVLWAINGGEIIVNGAVISSSHDKYATGAAKDGGAITLKSGSIGATAAEANALTTNGGTVYSKLGTAVVAKNSGTVNISGGTVETGASEYAAALSQNGATLNITGGTFKKSDGTFMTAADLEDYLAPGFTLDENGAVVKESVEPEEPLSII